MDFEIYSEIRKDLKKELDKNRYRHTINVAYTAVSLAMRYEYDLDRAYLAGLLHDCAKCFSESKRTSLCSKYGINLSESERRNPALIHAKLGEFVARDKYSVKDEDILSAIKWHTTGKENMSLLEKIIFIADYIEPGRNKQKNLATIRKAAFVDIDEAMFLITRDTLDYLSGKSGDIDENTRSAYEYYRQDRG